MSLEPDNASATRPPVWRAVASRLLPVMGVLALFGVVRLAYPGAVELHHDDAWVLDKAWRIGQGLELPLVGPDVRERFGYLGPATLYLFALPLRIWAAPLSAALFLAIVYLVAAWFLYRLCRDHLSRRVGLIAVALWGVSFYNLICTRRVNNLSLVQPLVVLFFFFLFKLVVDKNGRAVLPAAVCAALALQAHLSTVYCLVLLVAGCVASPPRRRDLIVGALAGLLVLSPVFWAEVASGGATTRGMLGLLAGPPGAAVDRLAVVTRYFALVSYINQRPDSLLSWSYALASKAEVLLLVGGLALVTWRAVWRAPWKGGDWRAALVLAWFALPLAAMAAQGAVEIRDYYLVLSYPAHFILIAWLIDDLARWLRAPRIALAAVAILALLQGLFAVGYQREVWRAGRLTTDCEYEIPLGGAQALAAILVQRFGVTAERFDTEQRRLHAIGWRSRFESLRGILAMSGPPAAETPGPETEILVSLRPFDTSRCAEVVEAPPYTVAACASSIDYASWEYALVAEPAPEEWVRLDDAASWRIYNFTGAPPLVFRGVLGNRAGLASTTLFVQSSSFVTGVSLDGERVYDRACAAQQERYYKLKLTEVALGDLKEGDNELVVETSLCGYAPGALDRHFFFDVVTAELE